MNYSTHKTEGVNRTQTMRFYPFVFTGKERDEETGYGYFGARYMDHELMTMWLSVDPMADKYPSISPYAYCAWNPVKLIDPDGMDWYDIDKFGNIQRNEVLSKIIANKVDIFWSTYKKKAMVMPLGTILSVKSNDTRLYDVKDEEIIRTIQATGTYVHIQGGSKKAKEIFDFFISNTDHIEFSLMQVSEDGDYWYLSTSHDHKTDPYTTALGLYFAMKGNLFSHRHYHPDNGIDSKKASPGDINFINATSDYMQNKGYNPKFYLSTYFDGRIRDYEYNEESEAYE